MLAKRPEATDTSDLRLIPRSVGFTNDKALGRPATDRAKSWRLWKLQQVIRAWGK